MDFSHSDIDARYSSFTQAGRDSYQARDITVLYQPIHITLCLFGSTRSRQVQDRASSRPISHPEALLQRSPVATYRRSNAGAILDTASGLIEQITGLLINCRDPSNGHRALELELKSLHQTLTLTRFAIQQYDNKPLGRSMANSVASEVGRCCIILQKLLDHVNGTCLGLKSTIINNLWWRVWWGRWNGDEFVWLRTNLSTSQQSLVGFLMALHSYVVLSFHAPSFTETPPNYEVLHGWSWETICKQDLCLLGNFMACFANNCPLYFTFH